MDLLWIYIIWWDLYLLAINCVICIGFVLLIVYYKFAGVFIFTHVFGE